MTVDRIVELLGDDADDLLNHKCECVSADQIQVPGPDIVERVWIATDRSPRVLAAIQQLLGHGRLGGTGYLSILPVDQGVEHSGAASFTPNPIYFDGDQIVKLAIEGGCNGVASTYGVLSSVARRYSHRIPFILKINHNELLTYPNQFDQVPFASVDQAFEIGCVGIGATIYYGSDNSTRQIQEVSAAFERAHELGMLTILWCYLRNPAFKVDGVDYHGSADLTGQAIHLGATIGADIVKQKQATNNGGYKSLNIEGSYGAFNPRIYDLTGEHPIDWVRYQVANAYMGRVGVINSGGSSGKNDLAQAVRTAVINKRGGGMGMISGRKAFQKPMKDGVALLNAIQDVYLSKDVTIA